jgi:hypothetical protein
MTDGLIKVSMRRFSYQRVSTMDMLWIYSFATEQWRVGRSAFLPLSLFVRECGRWVACGCVRVRAERTCVAVCAHVRA